MFLMLMMIIKLNFFRCLNLVIIIINFLLVNVALVIIIMMIIIMMIIMMIRPIISGAVVIIVGCEWGFTIHGLRQDVVEAEAKGVKGAEEVVVRGGTETMLRNV